MSSDYERKILNQAKNKYESSVNSDEAMKTLPNFMQQTGDINPDEDFKIPDQRQHTPMNVPYSLRLRHKKSQLSRIKDKQKSQFYSFVSMNSQTSLDTASISSIHRIRNMEHVKPANGEINLDNFCTPDLENWRYATFKSKTQMTKPCRDTKIIQKMRMRKI